MGSSEFNAGGNPAKDYPIQGRVDTLQVASSSWGKVQSDGLLNLYADFNLYLLLIGQASRTGVSVTIQETLKCKTKFYFHIQVKATLVPTFSTEEQEEVFLLSSQK